jgi:hypothetical protein
MDPAEAHTLRAFVSILQSAWKDRGRGFGDALQSAPETSFLGGQSGAIDAVVTGRLQAIVVEHVRVHLAKQRQQNSKHALVLGLFRLLLEAR